MEVSFNDKLKYIGYKTAKMYLSNNKNYFDCKNLLYNNRNIQYSNYDHYKDKRKVKLSKLKKDVKSKSGILLDGVDKTVSYISIKKFNHYLNSEYENLDYKIKNINIFNIPIEYDDRSCTYFKFSFNNTTPILINKICLENCSQYYNFLLESRYIHELGHVLMLKNKGSVSNYLHHEVIPISLELLYSYIHNDKEELNLVIKSRLYDTCSLNTYSYSSYEEYVKNNSYLVSSLLSFQLLEKYLDFNPNQQLEMRNRIKDCLNGKITVEKFMDDYEIGFNSDTSIKYLKKTIDRSKSI